MGFILGRFLVLSSWLGWRLVELDFLGDGFPCKLPGGPGCLEIEASSNAVDIEDFPCKMEVWDDAAFHGLEIDFVRCDSTTGHKFVFVHAFSFHSKTTLGKVGGKGGRLGLGEPRPGVRGLDAGSFGQPFP